MDEHESRHQERASFTCIVLPMLRHSILDHRSMNPSTLRRRQVPFSMVDRMSYFEVCLSLRPLSPPTLGMQMPNTPSHRALHVLSSFERVCGPILIDCLYIRRCQEGPGIIVPSQLSRRHLIPSSCATHTEAWNL